MYSQTKYLVMRDGDFSAVRIIGKAVYLNCRNVREFFDKMLEENVRTIEVDCTECTGMDSTFLGTLAGVALKMMNASVKGNLVLCGLNQRNMELVENLGLNRLVKINSTSSFETQITTEIPTEAAKSSEILSAHENLIKADSSNKAKFEDVIKFLKKEVDK